MSRLCKLGLTSICLAVFAGCQGGARLSGNAVHVASTKLGTLMLLPSDYMALHPELEKLFNQPVVFDTYLSGEVIGKQLDSNHAQFAILTAREYVQMPAGTKVELVAAGQNASGKTSREGLIVAKSSSTLQSPADCKGQRFCFGPKGDLLLESATLVTLEQSGVRSDDIKKELPPFSLDGRLHAGNSVEVAKLVAFDNGIMCGVVDEVTFNALPATGGSLLTGASRDQLRVIGHTAPVPELVVVASPKTDPVKVQLLREYLLTKAKSNADVCKQMGVTGFAAADETMYTDARKLAQKS